LLTSKDPDIVGRGGQGREEMQTASELTHCGDAREASL